MQDGLGHTVAVKTQPLSHSGHGSDLPGSYVTVTVPGDLVPGQAPAGLGPGRPAPVTVFAARRAILSPL